MVTLMALFMFALYSQPCLDTPPLWEPNDAASFSKKKQTHIRPSYTTPTKLWLHLFLRAWMQKKVDIYNGFPHLSLSGRPPPCFNMKSIFTWPPQLFMPTLIPTGSSLQTEQTNSIPERALRQGGRHGAGILGNVGETQSGDQIARRQLSPASALSPRLMRSQKAPHKRIANKLWVPYYLFIRRIGHWEQREGESFVVIHWWSMRHGSTKECAEWHFLYATEET